MQEHLDGGLNPLTDLVVVWSITHHGALEQIEADHVMEQRCRLMRIAASQTPRSLLLFDKPGNDAPGCLLAALEPGAPECRKAPRFGDDKPLKCQMLLLKQDAEECRPERPQPIFHTEFGDVYRDERCEEIVAQPFHDGDKKPLFVAKVIVHICLRASDDTDDLIDADAFIAVPEEQFGSDRADLFGFLVAATRAAYCSSRGLAEWRGGDRRSCRWSEKPRCPDLAEEILEALKRETQRALVR